VRRIDIDIIDYVELTLAKSNYD